MGADCHIHMVLDGVEWKSAIARHADRPDIAFIRKALAIYQSQGITYLRDGGDRWGVGAAARALAPEYGICYRTPLAPLCRQGHYGSFIGTTYETLEQYARLVVKTREAGGDFIKIMISGLMDFNQYGVLTDEGCPAPIIRELIAIAHSEGMAVMAHANGARVMEAAAQAGVDSIEHGAYPDTDALQAMAGAGVVWVPTVSTVGNLLGKGRYQQYQVEKILDRALENLSVFSALGGKVAVGTDAGAWAVNHGCNTEIQYLQQAGISASRLEEGNRAIQERF